jgi:multiple sugar transport system permease protein
VRWFAAGAFAPILAAAIGGVLWASNSVRGAHSELLRAETSIASELAAAPDRDAVLNSVFGDRWSVSVGAGAGPEELYVLREGDVLVGRAPVYDEDSWFQAGTITLRQADGRHASLPPLVLAALGVCTVLAALSLLAAIGTMAPRRRLVSMISLALLVTVPLVLADRWALAQLEQAGVQHMDVATSALDAAPRSLIERPGAIYQLAGLRHLEIVDGAVVFSTLPTGVTEDLAQIVAPVSGLVVADRTPFLVEDTERGRLALLPYSHTRRPSVVLFVMACVGVLLSAFVVWFSSLASRPRELRNNATAWTFLAPSFFHLSVFTLAPLVAAAWLSLHRWSLVDEARPFVALVNYAELVGDSEWWRAIVNTALFSLHVPVAMAVALGVALLLHRRVKGVVALRALFFLPTITSIVAIAIVWQWMFHPELGLINYVLSFAGIPPVRWLTSTTTALVSLMVMAVWMVVGYQVVLFLAGLAAIPKELYDAARIDGAGPWGQFVHVTIPGLRHTLFFVLVTSVIGSFQVFGAVFVMTQGGPLGATDVAVFHIYREAWEFLRFGSAAAMSWILFAIIFVVTWLQFKTLEERAEVAA